MSDNVKKLIASFEAERQKVYKTVKTLSLVGWPLFAIGFLMVPVCFFFQLPTTIAFIMAIIGIAGLIVACVGLAKKSNFRRKVASNLQSEINAELFPNAKYGPVGMTIQVLLKPGFFSLPDRYYSTNYMTAKYNGIEFEKCHYQFQRREETTDSKGHTTVSYVDYAVGTMYHFAYGRDFGGVLKLMEKSGFGYLGKSSLQKYETEYINFNKKFLTLSSDQQLVFYLLTPQIQEKIMSLEGMAKGQFYLCFIGNELYIAVNDNDSTVTIPFNKPMTEESMGTIVEYMSIPAVFIDLLGLTKTKFEKNAGVNPAA